MISLIGTPFSDLKGHGHDFWSFLSNLNVYDASVRHFQ